MWIVDRTVIYARVRFVVPFGSSWKLPVSIEPVYCRPLLTKSLDLGIPCLRIFQGLMRSRIRYSTCWLCLLISIWKWIPALDLLESYSFHEHWCFSFLCFGTLNKSSNLCCERREVNVLYTSVPDKSVFCSVIFILNLKEHFYTSLFLVCLVC